MRLDYCLENTEADSSKHTGDIKTNEADCGKSSKVNVKKAAFETQKIQNKCIV